MARVAEADAEVMIVSATRGEQGRSAMLRSRPGARSAPSGRTSCARLHAELGVQRVRVPAYPDGTLQHHRSSLGAAITGIMRSSIRTP